MHDDLQKELERDFRKETRKNWMYDHRAFLIIATMMLVAMCIGALVTYVPDMLGTSEDGTSQPDSPDGIAATIDGHDIKEEEVTAYITQYRNYAGYQEDGNWATFLDGMSSSAESMRDDAIKSLAKRFVVSEHAKELGITVTHEMVESRMEEEAKQAGYDGLGKDYEEHVTKTLMYPSMEDYRADVEMKILLDRLVESDMDPIEPTEIQMVVHASNATASYVGSRTYDAVVTLPEDATASDVEKAKGIADSVAKRVASCKSTEDFLSATSDVDGMEVEDRGWSCLYEPTAAYIEAITDLRAGAATEPFRDADGWHVVWCAETFTTRPDSVLSLSEMPEEIYRALKVDTMEDLLASKMSDYADELLTEHNLKTNPMPSGLPYDVDMDLSYYRQETADNEDLAQSGLDALEQTSASDAQEGSDEKGK